MVRNRSFARASWRISERLLKPGYLSCCPRAFSQMFAQACRLVHRRIPLAKRGGIARLPSGV